jgi:glutamine amidotransferase
MSRKIVTILDYGLGNITSLVNSLKYLNYEVNFFSKKKKNIQILIIPGVGSFDSAIKILKKKNYIPLIKKLIRNNLKIIGICLGMQILLSLGYENGKNKGLNIIKGKVLKIRFEKKLPIVGYFPVIFSNNRLDLKSFENKKFYHVHSYVAAGLQKKNMLCFTKFKKKYRYISGIYKKNIVGLQFHPEKSGKIGINFLDHLLSKI